MNVYLPNLRLPSAYQEVEYIESSGNQFIDTGYLITPTTEVSIDYQYTNANNQDFAFGVGSDTDTSSGMTFCSYIGTTGGVAYFKAGLSDGTGSSTFTNNGPGTDTNRHKFVLNNGHFLTYNSSGTLQKDVTTSATFTRTATHSFGLFCWWRTDTSEWSNKTSAKLYGCEVKDNGVLQRDFVPCYRKSDSVIGLYDLVNNQFYTNAGTGTFTKGSDVTMAELKNAYIGGVIECDFTQSDYGFTFLAKGSNTDSYGRDTNGWWVKSKIAYPYYADLILTIPNSIFNKGLPKRIEITRGGSGENSDGGGAANIYIHSSNTSYISTMRNNLYVNDNGTTQTLAVSNGNPANTDFVYTIDIENKTHYLSANSGTKQTIPNNTITSFNTAWSNKQLNLGVNTRGGNGAYGYLKKIIFYF